MKHKASFMRYFIVAMLTVVCAVFCFAGCKKAEEVTVTWNIAEHATVTVEGYTELPLSVEKGASLVFSITCDTGYEVDTVKNGTRNASEKDGKYTVKVSEDTTISVTVKQTIQSVDVTKKPTKLTYNAGETLDKTGMEVEVVYVGGSKESLKESDYRIVYQGGVSALSFGLGDTYFKVSYQGKESAEVNLDATVIAVVTLDLNGAKLTDEYLNGLKANTELANVKSENGILSFTYAKALTKAVALPTAEDLMKGDHEGDYDFIGWTNGVTELAIGDTASYNLTASFSPNLVRLSKVYYEMQDDVPYLILKGTFQLADSFHLYLYEGNVPPVWILDENGDLTGNRGEEFAYKFDMRKLAQAKTEDGKDFSGKWMDIKIQTTLGEEIQNMDIDITRYPKDFVDTDATLTWEDYVFSFATYTPEGTEMKHLKAVFNPKPAEYSFTVAGGKTAEGLPTLIVNGTAASQFEGQYARVDIESVSEAQYGKIESGKWTVTFVLGPGHFELRKVGYMHFNIVENETDGKGSGWKPNNDNNLGNVACTNDNLADNGDFAYQGGDGYLLSGMTLRIANDDSTLAYYVGPGKWGGFIIYGRNEQVPLETKEDVQIALKVDNMENPTKVYYVFEVFTYGADPYEKEEIQNLFMFGNVDSNTEVYPCERIDDLGGGVYRVWYNITDYTGGQLWPNVYIKDEVAEGATQTYTKVLEIRNAVAGSAVEKLYAIVDGTKYTIKVEWGGACIVPTVANAGEKNPESANPEKLDATTPDPDPDPEPEPSEIEYTLTDIDLLEEDGKPYFVLKGTYTGGTKEELKTVLEAVYFDFETNANMGANGWNRKADYPRTVETTDTGWTIKIDVSSLTQPASPHFKASNGDIKLGTDHAQHDKTITVGGFEYKIFNKPENDNPDYNFWGNVGLMVADVRLNGKSYTVGTADLVIENSKVYYTVVATFTGFTAEELAKLDEIVQFGDSGKQSDMYKPAKYEAVEGQENTYKFYFDITDRAVSGDMLYAHLFVYTASQDVKDAASNGKTVTLGGKTYTIKCVEGDPADGGTWGMSNLFVSEAEE